MHANVLWFARAADGMAVTPRLRIRGIGWHDRMAPGMVDRPRGTNDWLIMHFHAPVVVWLDGGRRDCPAHTLVVWKPGQRHTFGNPGKHWMHSWIHCVGPAISGPATAAALPFDRPIALGDALLVERWLRPIHEELSQRPDPDGEIVESLLTILVRELRRAVAPAAGSHLPERLLHVLRAIEADPRRPWRLGDLAREARLSPSRFSAEFRTHLGCAPMEHLQRVRMRQALHLLRDRNLAIKEIAAQVGFPDPFYFSRRFRELHGESPVEHRRRLIGA